MFLKYIIPIKNQMHRALHHDSIINKIDKFGEATDAIRKKDVGRVDKTNCISVI